MLQMHFLFIFKNESRERAQAIVVQIGAPIDP